MFNIVYWIGFIVSLISITGFLIIKEPRFSRFNWLERTIVSVPIFCGAALWPVFATMAICLAILAGLSFVLGHAIVHMQNVLDRDD